MSSAAARNSSDRRPASVTSCPSRHPPAVPSPDLRLDDEDIQRRVRAGHLPVVVVLRDHGQPMLDGGRGDQGVQQLDRALDPCGPAVGDQPRAQVTITASLTGIGSAVRARASVSARWARTASEACSTPS